MFVRTMMSKFTLISYIVSTFFFKGKAQNISTIPSIIITPEVKLINTPEIILNDEKYHFWNSTNFPLPYPVQNQEVILKAPSGCFVQITIDSLDLDGENGDFLAIKPGTTLDSQKEGKVFTYQLKTEKKYLVHSNNVYLSFQVFGQNVAGKKGFSLRYQRVGTELATTTDGVSATVTWPTTSSFDSVYYTVYMSGNENDFKDEEKLREFKTDLSAMATEYCAISNISLKENITIQNVHIYYITQCPSSWPNHEACVKIRFALPVVLLDNSTIANDSNVGYQLSESNLRKMWSQLATKYLEVYKEPDNKGTSTVWMVICIVTLIVFVAIMYLGKVISKLFSTANNSKRRMSDTDGIISNSTRVSQSSLAPHPYQTTPSFFDNDYAFDQFEPDIGIPKKAYNSASGNDYPYPLSDDDSDNDIVFSNFNNSRSNAEVKESKT